MNADIAVAGIGWVLPTGVGSGTEILERSDWARVSMTDKGSLAGFSAKPYLSSVKGYLDPAGSYCLAASALALGRDAGSQPTGLQENSGICTLTHYGAPLSGFRFYEQLVEKGPRYASPLIFPHGYANTAGNLCAIEFEFGGPHMVLSGPQDVREAFAFAAARLNDGTAGEMLVSVYESTDDRALPDDLAILDGAVSFWLKPARDAAGLLSLNMERIWAVSGCFCGRSGAVMDALRFLRAVA